jgi:phosphatidylserine/phosphatidylglycerophosphate/cardiolipin synthase-like enzyme
MRIGREAGGLKVHAVAGTYVVSLGLHMDEADCEGLLGFSIHRTDHEGGEAGWLTGMKAFEDTDPGLPAGSRYSTEQHPIQSFQWADYSAKPGRRYTYRIAARTGTPAALETAAEVSVTVTTESPEGGDHDVYFNRGVAASQEYARRFGNRAPEDVPGGEAFEWLSRGIYEGLEAFLGSARPGRDSLRIAAYEFSYDRVLELLRATLDRGVDIRICYDGRTSGSAPGERNREAVERNGLDGVSVARTRPATGAISHNKFIVKLVDGRPASVWTGGMNFSEGGIFGHSNVAHVVEDEGVAAAFLDYWEVLERDPARAALAREVERISPLPPRPRRGPPLPPPGTTVVFSPRAELDALNWYADLAKNAREGLMMTFAFGMNDLFKEAYESGDASFRLALMEKATGSFRDPARREAEEQRIRALRAMPQNVFAIGAFVPANALDGWLEERLSGLNRNVRYVHNKFMLIDPLGDDPIVIAGSANFSAASTDKNDENMIVVRGNTRVADIYLGEFMRLWSHHAFRESLGWRRGRRGRRGRGGGEGKWLSTGDWWRDSFGDTERSVRRRFFARTDT